MHTHSLLPVTPILIGALTGCATMSHGTIAERIGKDEAQVYLGRSDGIAAGDRVALYRQDCLEEMGSNVMFMEDTHCDRIHVGDGTVEEVLDDHTSRIKADPGVKFGYGTVVEQVREDGSKALAH
jgi:hypothetical protein